jgi:hypothetical protein
MSREGWSISSEDLAVIAGQLGRPPREITGVAVRCPFDYPAVIETAPTLGEAPNPTLLYLTCPTMARAVSRVEAAGAVREFRAWIQTDEEAYQTLEVITGGYKRRRASLAKGKSTRILRNAGIGGPAGPEKASCLHAYVAAMLAAASGWLEDESSPNADHIGQLDKIWTRFFSPAEEMWCGDVVCRRLGSGECPRGAAESS